jgi:prophage regulatory protein
MSLEHAPQRSTAAYSTDRFIGEDECEQITDLSRTTRWRLERCNKFPTRRQIAPNRVGWRLSEVLSWMESRAAGTRPNADEEDVVKQGTPKPRPFKSQRHTASTSCRNKR